MANNQQVRVDLQFKGDMSDVEKKLQQLQNTLSGITSGKAIKDMAFTSDINKAVGDATKLQAILKNTTMANGNLDLTKFRSELQKSGMTVKELGNSLLSLGPQGSQAFSQLTQSIMSAEVPLKRTSTLLSNFATTLKNTAKWQISSSILHGFMSSVSSAYNYAQDLNESLNNIRIVSKQNTDQMAEFAKEANKAAKELSISTTAYTDAALIFYQQGLEGNAVTERTDVVAKMSNVTRDSVDEVSSYMTAIWNNFDDGSESLEHYADVITGLGAATASSSAEIAAGLEKFAAVADVVGLSYDYATSALATVVAQTRQSADTVGTAFKTLFARIEGLKLGKTLEDGVDLNKYSAALNTIGVKVLDANGQLRNMDDILDDMGAKWKQIGKEQQVALAQTVAGTRQYNQLVALMDNWDKVQDNLQIARSSDGELQAQADIYAESWEAAQKRVRAAWESIYSSLFDDKFFIKLTNGLGSFIEGIDKVVKSLGGLKGILPLLSVGLLNLFNKDIANGINNFVYNLQIGTKKAQKDLIDFKQQAFSTFDNKTSDGSMASAAAIDSLKGQYNIRKAMLDIEKQYVDKGIELTDIQKMQNQYEVERLRILGEEMTAKAELVDKSQQELNVSERVLINSIKKAAGSNFVSDEEKQITTNDVGGISGVKVNLISPKDIQDVLDYGNAVAQVNVVTDEFLRIKNSQGLKAAAEWIGPEIENMQELAYLYEKGDKEVQEYINQLRELGEASGDTEKVNEVFNKINNNFINLSDKFEEKVKILKQLIKDVLGEGEGVNNILKNIDTIKAKLDDLQEKQSGHASSKTNYDSGIKAAQKRIEDEISNSKLQMPDFGKTFTDATRSITTFGTALNSLSNVFKTLNDENASFGDKLLSIVTSGGMAITMLGSSAKSLINAFNPLIKNVEILTTLNKVTTTDLQEQIALMMEQGAIKNGQILLDKIKLGNEAVYTKEEATQLSLIAIKTGLESNEIGILSAIVALSKLETTEQEKQVVLQKIKEKLQGKFNFKNIFSGLKNIGSSLTSIVGTLGTAGVVLGVVVAAVAAAVIAYKAYRNHLKAVAEEATNTAKKEQEKLQTIKEETQAIDDLTTKYAELNAQLSDLGEENARAEMFKMAVQAGQTDLAIKALASSFKSFGDILDNVADEQNEVYKQQAKTAMQASQNAVYANLRTVKEKFTDNFGATVDIGKGTFGGQNQEFNKQLQEQFGLVVDSSGHVDTNEFIRVLSTNQEKFVNFINSSNASNAKNLQEIYGEIKDSAEMLKEAGAAYSDSVEKSLISSKKKSIAEIKTLKEYEDIKKDLIKEASETDLFEYKGIDSLQKQNEWARDLVLQQDALNDRLEKQLYLQDEILAKSNIGLNGESKQVGLSEYLQSGGTFSEIDASKLVGDLWQQIQDNTGLTRGILTNYLMAGIEKVPAEAKAAFDEAIALIEAKRPSEATTFTIYAKIDENVLEEDKKQLQETIDKLNDDQLNYVTINIDRFSSIEDLEKVLKGDFKERIEAFNQKEGIVTLSTAVNELDLSKKQNTGFDSGQIHGFFNYNDKINGYDEGQFAGLETSQQLYNIMQGVDEMAANYAQHRKEAKEEAEQELTILKQQRDEIEGTGIKKDIDAYVENAKDVSTDIKDFDSMVDFLDEYNTALNEGKAATSEFKNKNEELLKALNLFNKVDKGHLENLVKEGKQYRENKIAIQHTLEEIESYNEEIDEQIDKLQAAKQMYLAVNKEMDSLQDAYKTIKGAQEEWTKEGYLTMDTVQSLISLDNAYMSTLEVTANGIKMNEEAYVGVTQAKYASLAASIALQAQELINQYVNGNLTASELMKEMQMYASADASYSAADAALAEARATLAAKAANDEYAATIGNYLDAVEKKINLLKQAGSQVNTGNVGKVLGYSPKGGGGSKKSKETKDLKEYADEFDRFYPFQKVIDDLADAISDLAKEQEHLAGGELVGSIRYQNKLLQEQKKAYQELAKEQKKYQKEMQADLAKYGMSFDTASGNIVNYAQSTQAMLDQYNAAIEKYNKSAQSDADKKTLEAVEKEYEKFKKLVSNYQGILTEIQDTENNLDDIYYEQIANNLKEFEIMVQVKLDIGEAQRMVNDFISKINKNFKTLKKSTQEWMDVFETALKNAHSYVDGDLGTINVDMDALNKVKNAIDSGDYGHEGAMFASETEAITKYKELAEQLKDDANDLYELYKQAWEDYIDAVDESIEAWENIIDQFDEINDALDHYEKLTELLYGDNEKDKSAQLNLIYQKQIENSLAKQRSIVQAIRTEEEAMQKILASGGSENDQDYQAHYQAWLNFNKERMAEEENFQEYNLKQLQNYLDQAKRQLEESVFGKSLEDVKDEWNKAKKEADKYYDSVSRVYQLDKLKGSYATLINDTTSLKLKKQLAELQDKELDKLSKKEKLSKADIEIAEKRLAVEQARIALEESQNNKSQMRLQRDSQGNWNYQFVANDDDIAEKEQTLNDKIEEWRNAAINARREIQEEWLELFEEYETEYLEIIERTRGNEEERDRQLAELKATYIEKEKLLREEAYYYDVEIGQATVTQLGDLYIQDKDNFEWMTEEQKTLIEGLKENGINSYSDLFQFTLDHYGELDAKTEEVMRNGIEWWNTSSMNAVEKTNNVGEAIDQFFMDVEEALSIYDQNIRNSEEASEEAWSNVGERVEEVGERIDEVTDKVQECIDRSQALSDFRDRVMDIEEAWYSVKDSITAALEELEDYLRKLLEVKDMQDAVKENAPSEAGTPDLANISGNGKSDSGNTGNTGTRAEETSASSSYGDKYKVVKWEPWNHSYATLVSDLTRTEAEAKKSVYEHQHPGNKYEIQKDYGSWSNTTAKTSGVAAGSYDVSYSASRNAQQQDVYRKYRKMGSYATGGYTGSWSDGGVDFDDGKLAVLHQKELVLNQSDTSNILDAVKMVRNMNSSNNEFANYLSEAISAGVDNLIQTLEYGLNAMAERSAYTASAISQVLANGSNSGNPLEQNVHIDASFPNVTDRYEIESVFNNLVNVASQRILSTDKINGMILN